MSTPPTPATDTQEESMKLGGGTANGMRALGYQVLPPEPNSDSTCWRMIAPQSRNTEYLAADQAECWRKAEKHWHARNLENVFRRTPPTPATDEREAVARALCKSEGTGQCAAMCLSHFARDTKKGKCAESVAVWGRKADAALSALRETRAAEILAAEANERARIATYLNMRAEQWRDLAVAHSGDALKWADCSARENELLRQAIAIEPNEHGAGK